MNFANRNRALAGGDGEDHRHPPRLGAADLHSETRGALVREARGPRPRATNGQRRPVHHLLGQLQRPEVGPGGGRGARAQRRARATSRTSAAAACPSPTPATSTRARAQRRAQRRTTCSPTWRPGADVVVPGPSCSLMLKQEYPKLLGSDAARKVADATRDLMEYVYHLARAKKLKRDFTTPARQGRLSRSLSPARPEHRLPRPAICCRLVAEEVELVDACSGVDGTWGMQARFHEESLEVAREDARPHRGRGRRPRRHRLPALGAAHRGGHGPQGRPSDRAAGARLRDRAADAAPHASTRSSRLAVYETVRSRLREAVIATRRRAASPWETA